MSEIPLSGAAPTTARGDALYADGKSCFVCSPPYKHLREWIPDPNHLNRPRTLVLCFDGTGDSFDQDNSNVVQLFSMLKKDDPTKQLVYYQAGIGTYTGNGVIGTPIIQSTSKLLDEMVAWNLPSHIKDGYLFLMQNYHEGDQICIFGFSRGAYTARALAGMLQKVGLLPQCNLEQLPFAYDMYTRDDQEGLELSIQFKRAFSIDVKIQLLGVWDTVQSVGLIPKHLPFSGSNNAIVFFRHALALDEHRVKFIPFFWTLGKPEVKVPDALQLGPSRPTSEDPHHKTERREHSGASYDFETRMNAMTGPPTDVEEVFFAGAHCDVGGGSVKNNERHSLARIPLRWMIRECLKHTGIIFDAHMLKHECGMDVDSIKDFKDLKSIKAPDPLPPHTRHLDKQGETVIKGFSFIRIPVTIVSGLSFPLRWSWRKLSKLAIHHPPQVVVEQGPVYEGEPHEELGDALSPIYDQLTMHWYWKLMEAMPWIMKKQSAEIADSDEFWAYKWVWNWSKGRQVYGIVMDRGMKVHRSVKIRMLARGPEGDNKPYVPKVRCTIHGKPRTLTREEWLADEPRYFVWTD